MKDLISWLSLQNKLKNKNGFVIDYTKPSLSCALCIYAASSTQKGCTILVKDNSLIPNDKANIINISLKDNLCAAIESAKLSYNTNKLLIQPFCNVELELIRPWNAKIEFISDLLPLAKFSLLDIKAMYASVADMDNDITKKLFELDSRQHYSGDVQFSFAQLNWAYKTNQHPMYRNIITDEKDPATHKMWGTFTSEQKKIVAFLHQRYKMTNYLVQQPLEF